MISALGRFAETLRGEGVRVSPAELLDATRALEAVGLQDRARFRAALRATLAKSARQREIFDRAFERFFAAPRLGGKEGKGEKGRAGKRSEHARRSPPARDEPRTRTRPGEREELRALLESARDARRVGRLRSVRLERSQERSPRAPSALRDEKDLTRKELRALTSEEERTLARALPRLVLELRLRTGRRLGAARSGRFWARRLFRENLAHEGVPFTLPFRRRRPRRARVVLVVDVSYSVARAAGYFLRMAGELLEIERRARVVAFVDRPVDATAAVRRWLERGRGGSRALPAARPARRGRRRARPGEGIEVGGLSFADVLEDLPGLDLEAASDYGRAFHALLRSELRPAGRDTVLVILGDGRTNRFDPLAWSLEEIARRCRAVLWLVPEPETRWGTGDSALARYLPWVDVAVEAHDLAGLGRGLEELVRKL